MGEREMIAKLQRENDRLRANLGYHNPFVRPFRAACALLEARYRREEAERGEQTKDQDHD